MTELLNALRAERKRLEAEIQKVDKALGMFDGQPGKGKKASKRTPEANEVSRAAQALRWAKSKREGKDAIAKAEKELEAAKKKLAESKK